jgi:hypothetical protein
MSTTGIKAYNSNLLCSIITYLFVVWMDEKSSLLFGILRTTTQFLRERANSAADKRIMNDYGH